jgi:hypothetical protein
MRYQEEKEKKGDAHGLEMSDLSSGWEEEKDDHDDEKKTHPAIIHALIDNKEELLKAVFFSDMPKVFSFIEKNLTDVMSIDIKSHLRLAIQQNNRHISHLLSTLQRSQGKQPPNSHHFRLLLACICHNKPKLFEHLLIKLNISEFSAQQIFQFYWLALYLKQENFCTLLQENGVQPLPGVIRLAYLYKTSLDIIDDLWDPLNDTEKMQVLHWIRQSVGPTQKLEHLHLPESITGWAQKSPEISEVKPIPGDQIPVLSVSPYPLTMQTINGFAERQEYTRIIIEMSDDFFPAIYRKIKKYAVGKPNKNHIEHLIEWVDCLFGSPVRAAQIFLQDHDLLRVPDGLHFCLSLYNQERMYLLPVQWLTAAFLENRPLKMPAFRALRHLTNIPDDDSKELQGISSGAWNRNELLEGERLYINQLIKPLTLQDSFGDLTQEIVTRLSLPEELILAELPIPVSTSCQEIIVEYLSTGEQKNLQTLYPGLNPSSMLRKQIGALTDYLQENQNIIDQLRPLLRRPETWKRWVKKNSHHLWGWPLSGAGIISFSFRIVARIKYNAAIISQLTWQECMNQGYELQHFMGTEVCNKKAIPDPAIPECNVLCEELYEPPVGMSMWLIFSIFLILAPFFTTVFKEIIGCVKQLCGYRSPTENIIPDGLNNRINQHYRCFNVRPPLEIEHRSAVGVDLFISDLTARGSDLQDSLKKLESKKQPPLPTPIMEEQEQTSVKKTKGTGMTDFFKARNKDPLSIPLLSTDNAL